LYPKKVAYTQRYSMFRGFASMEPGSNIECYDGQNLKKKVVS